MSNTNKNSFFNIPLENNSKKDIREKIIKYIKSPHGFFHIISLNPENLVIASHDDMFKRIISTAQIKLIDGLGTVMAAQILTGMYLVRTPGVDTMIDLLPLIGKERLKALFIGGRANLAIQLAHCQKQSYPQADFIGLEGFKNIKNPTLDEERAVLAIVQRERPQIIFAAFGSPYQEKWFDRHKDRLGGIICMGVGGGFDYLGGKISRAPRILQRLGLEWLYRLFRQPWRWRRQFRLVEFILLVVRQYIRNM